MSHSDHSDLTRGATELMNDPRLAHGALFAHRHPQQTPRFHRDIIDTIHSDHPRVLIMAFRGAAKSTLTEEATIIDACFKRFNNKVILGSSFHRAADRLRAIKYEFEHNDYLELLFGSLIGPIWNEDKIVLSNGVCIQAFGREQSFRGVKHLDHRPDRLDVDDLEDEDATRTPEAREKLRSWFLKVVLPALEPTSQVRVYATPLDPDALPMHLKRSEDWLTKVYPVKYLNEDGEWAASWPDRNPLAWIDKMEKEMRSLGGGREFAQEYMCEPEDQETKLFTADMIRVAPKVHTWQPTYAVYDPARTVKATSATTGKVVFSWIGNRLVIWDGGGYFWKPDELIDDMFKTDDEFHPIAIGVEQTGLNEWVLQPMRQQQVVRSQPLPVRALDAPRDKLGFIRSLQPFFKSHEVEFAQDLPTAREQLLNYPTGRIDFPNALAYALVMRPGQPIYDGFTDANIADVEVLSQGPLYLVLNATAAYTTGQLVQVTGGRLHVVADWLREGDPGAVLADIVAAAGLAAGRHFVSYAPGSHFADMDRVGLVAAARKVPVRVRSGGALTDGREEVRRLLGMQRRGLPLVWVSQDARWTLGAFAGGYAKKVLKSGLLATEAVDGPYRIMMEGLESFAAVMRAGSEEEDKPKYAFTPKGKRYVTAMATGVEEQRELKG